MKILSLGKLNNSRIKSILIIKKEFNLSPIESKQLLDNLLNNKLNDIYIDDYQINAIQSLFDYVDYEHDYDTCHMDLGSSKYSMLQYQEELGEANKWYDTLTNKEKEYVDRLIRDNIPVG